MPDPRSDAWRYRNGDLEQEIASVMTRPTHARVAKGLLAATFANL